MIFAIWARLALSCGQSDLVPSRLSTPEITPLASAHLIELIAKLETSAQSVIPYSLGSASAPAMPQLLA